MTVSVLTWGLILRLINISLCYYAIINLDKTEEEEQQQQQQPFILPSKITSTNTIINNISKYLEGTGT